MRQEGFDAKSTQFEMQMSRSGWVCSDAMVRAAEPGEGSLGGAPNRLGWWRGVRKGAEMKGE